MLKRHRLFIRVKISNGSFRKDIQDGLSHALDVTLVNGDADQSRDNTFGARMDDVPRIRLEWVNGSVCHHITVADDGHTVNVMVLLLDRLEHFRQRLRVHPLFLRSGRAPAIGGPI